MVRNPLWRLGVLAVMFTALAGCTTQARYYSSAVDYLYPHKREPVEKPSVPVMKIPIDVGIAFVPGGGEEGHRGFWQEMLPGKKRPAPIALTEKQKIELMKVVADHFQKYNFIGSIEIIPSAYLIRRGSFANLDQIRTMYGVDVVALLAYDQVQFTDEGAASFLYWTVVGAYVVPGEKNSTQTMMDAVVYDIESRKMLFRAPGTSQVKGRATPANLSEELREDSEKGFQLAADDMIKNLDLQLALFKDKVKKKPKEYKVIHRQGYTGGGSLDVAFLAIFALLGGLAWRRHRRN